MALAQTWEPLAWELPNAARKKKKKKEFNWNRYVNGRSEWRGLFLDLFPDPWLWTLFDVVCIDLLQIYINKFAYIHIAYYIHTYNITYSYPHSHRFWTYKYWEPVVRDWCICVILVSTRSYSPSPENTKGQIICILYTYKHIHIYMWNRSLIKHYLFCLHPIFLFLPLFLFYFCF